MPCETDVGAGAVAVSSWQRRRGSPTTFRPATARRASPGATRTRTNHANMGRSTVVQRWRCKATGYSIATTAHSPRYAGHKQRPFVPSLFPRFRLRLLKSAPSRFSPRAAASARAWPFVLHGRKGRRAPRCPHALPRRPLFDRVVLWTRVRRRRPQPTFRSPSLQLLTTQATRIANERHQPTRPRLHREVAPPTAAG